MAQYCFGIDVGGTSIKCGLFDTSGRVLDKWEIKTRVEDGGKQILPDAAQSILEKIKEKSLTPDSIAGIGIGVPGPVDENGAITCAVNLNWGQKNIENELRSLAGYPVKAANDANVAALGEMWKGGGEGARSLILVTLGTGVGGGIIVDGRIVVGAHGAGGEIGHACVNPEEEEACNCGNHGCLEQTASATGIARVARRLLAESEKPSVLRNGEVTAKEVFDAYKKGDQLAEEIVTEFADCLGRALANFTTVIDPQVIVIGGGVSKAGDVLIQVIEKYYKKYAFSACRNTPVVLAKLGNDAGIYGAAKLILDAES
jgi:glucokinase